MVTNLGLKMIFKEKYDSASWVGLTLVLLISLFFVFYTFDLNFIMGNARYWEMERADITQHIAGIAMYLSSPWQFPLLAFDSLNYPQGTRVTFVDGIPLFALLLKVFLPKNMEFFNPLGYWVVLCFVLQGVSAWWISRELEIKSWFFLLFLLILFLTYPALIMRLRHVSLMSHWILLFAIALYLRGNRLRHIQVLPWTLFLAASFYINIYLFAMAMGIYLAAIFEMKETITLKKTMLLSLPLLVLVSSLFLFLLPLPSVSLVKEKFFDLYGMSLFSPFIGGKIIQWQVGISWNQRDEGFGYLGLGVILSFIYIIVVRYNQFLLTINRHKPFFMVMLVYLIYSFSSHIYFGSQLVAIVSYPKFLDFITGEFRCAGRFFWPVGYAIIIFCAYKFYHQLNKRAFAVFVCAILAVQLIDLSDCYKNIKAHTHFEPHHILDYSAMNKLLGKNIKNIYFYPKYKCTTDDPYRIDTILPVMRYAAVQKLNMNTGYIARYKPACNDVVSEIALSNYNESVYIFDKKAYPNMKVVLEVMNSQSNIMCEELRFIYVCKF